MGTCHLFACHRRFQKQSQDTRGPEATALRGMARLSSGSLSLNLFSWNPDRLADSAPRCVSLCHGITRAYPGQPQLRPFCPLLAIMSCYALGRLYVTTHYEFEKYSILLYEIPNNNKKAKERKRMPWLYDKEHHGRIFSTYLTLSLLMRVHRSMQVTLHLWLRYDCILSDEKCQYFYVRDSHSEITDIAEENNPDRIVR